MRGARIIGALLLGTAAGAAQAGDKPLVTPMPAWIRPVAAPAAPPAKGDAPVTILLSDQQVRFERGSITTFVHLLMRVNTGQGLSAGNISLPWRPDVGDLQVHRLVLHRDGKTIDVLASGQTFTVVRREANLENAMLDGVLTANIQPEGLQVGDMIELALSETSRDPVLAGHVEAAAAIGGPLPITRAHFAASWPAALPVRASDGGGLPALRPGKPAGGEQGFEFTLDDLQPAILPKLAPARYRLGRRVELSDFTAWSDLGALLAPLYAKAAVLPASGPLADEVAKIRAASSDPKARATAALALVQDRVRYVALAMGAGGLVPSDAATTWSRRFGDCKAKTALLLAILHALGIPAEPVAASSAGGDGLDQRLPSVGAFDHVLVRATVAGQPYWLDGTRTGDTSLDRIVTPRFGWGLPLVPRGAALVRMLPPPLTRPASETEVVIDATQGLSIPAPATVTQIWRGDAALGLNSSLSNYGGDARDRALREMWKGQYDFIDIDRTDARFDAGTGEMRLTMAGKARMDWSSGWYETDGLGLGYRADLAREDGPDKDAPFAVDYPVYTRNVETIRLPPGFPETVALAKVEIDRTVAGIEYRRHGSIEGRVFHAEATQRSIAPEFPARDAATAQAALREMAGATLYIQRPSTYMLSDAELVVAQKEVRTTVGPLLERGYALAERGRIPEALADYDAALKIEPKNENALANRGLMHAYKGDADAAEHDLAAAQAINSRDRVVFHGQGILAQRRNDHEAAYRFYSSALDTDPKDGFALVQRAAASRALGRNEAALTDIDAAIRLFPANPQLVLTRFNILRQLGRNDDALAAIRAMPEGPADPAWSHVAAANALSALGRQDEALHEFDRALAIKPAAYIYVNRAGSRPRADRAGRLADLDAALKLEPKSIEAVAGKADLLREGGDNAGAITDYNAALVQFPDNLHLLTGRGIAELHIGRHADSDRDFAAARKAAENSGAPELNNLCWIKATENVALDSALADCEAALAREPKAAATLDSKAFVLLRLGRTDEAIATYGQALALVPTKSSSLYGRGIAYGRRATAPGRTRTSPRRGGPKWRSTSASRAMA